MRLVLPSLIAATVLLAACGSSPDYYLLPPPENQTGRRASPAETIAVVDISLPSYIEANEIAALDEVGVVEVNEDALWADSPRRALTLHLVAALQARLEADIAGEPWPGFESPALRLEVVANRMIGRPGGAVEFTGQYLAVAPETGRIVLSERFAIAVPVRGVGYPALLAAHGNAIETLAEEIAGRIAGLRAGSV